MLDPVIMWRASSLLKTEENYCGLKEMRVENTGENIIFFTTLEDVLCSTGPAETVCLVTQGRIHFKSV